MFNTISFNDLLTSVSSTTSAFSSLWTPAAVIIGVLLAFIVIDGVVGLLGKKQEKEYTPEVHDI